MEPDTQKIPPERVDRLYGLGVRLQLGETALTNSEDVLSIASLGLFYPTYQTPEARPIPVEV